MLININEINYAKNCNLDICHNRTRNSKTFISSRKYPSAMCLARELSVWKISVEEVSVRNVSGRGNDLRRSVPRRSVWSRTYALGMCLVVKMSLVEVSVEEFPSGKCQGVTGSTFFSCLIQLDTFYTLNGFGEGRLTMNGFWVTGQQKDIFPCLCLLRSSLLLLLQLLSGLRTGVSKKGIKNHENSKTEKKGASKKMKIKLTKCSDITCIFFVVPKDGLD